MSLKFAKVASLAVITATAGFSLWARTLLPDAPIATHFDAAGHVNGTMPRDTALAFMPLVALGIAVFMLWILPAMMPKKASLERSAEAYGASVIVVMLFLALVHVGLIALAMHYPIDLKQAALVGAGVVFIVIGNYLPKTRYNFVIGIRTPWTLSNEEVWDRTHRLAGPLHMLLGALILADAWLVPFPWSYAVMAAGAGGVTLACVVYAWLVSRKLNPA